MNEVQFIMMLVIIAILWLPTKCIVNELRLARLVNRCPESRVYSLDYFDGSRMGSETKIIVNFSNGIKVCYTTGCGSTRLLLSSCPIELSEYADAYKDIAENHCCIAYRTRAKAAQFLGALTWDCDKLKWCHNVK